jgi:hypothetical protein
MVGIDVLHSSIETSKLRCGTNPLFVAIDLRLPIQNEDTRSFVIRACMTSTYGIVRALVKLALSTLIARSLTTGSSFSLAQSRKSGKMVVPHDCMAGWRREGH